jgi:hypothetical protein
VKHLAAVFLIAQAPALAADLATGAPVSGIAESAAVAGNGVASRPAGDFPTHPELQYFAGDSAADTAVSIAGEGFRINGSPTYPDRRWNGDSIEGLLINARMVNGIYDDMDGDVPGGMLPWNALSNTQDFLRRMDDWRAQGLRAFTINLQGGSNRCNGLAGNYQSAKVDNNPYGASGTQAFDDWYQDKPTSHARYLTRLGSIIRRADDLGMVVILGLFYFGQDESLESEAAVVAAVDAASDWIRHNGWTNVLVEINNESDLYYDHEILQPARVHELIARVRDRTGLLTSTSGSGGYLPQDDWITQSDFVLVHTNSLDPGGVRRLIAEIRERPAWREKKQPILINEDSTSTENFLSAVGDYASWGYYDNWGYQCVFPETQTYRWSLEMASDPDYWGLVKKLTGGM